MKEQMEPKNFLDKFFSVVELKSLKGITIVLAIVCVIMLVNLGNSYQKDKEPDVISEYTGMKTQADEFNNQLEEPKKIFVHIKGEVNSPGLYEVDFACRIHDAINIAGGFTENAAVDRVNLAEKLSDEEELFVPSKSENSNASQSYKSTTSSKSNVSKTSSAKTTPKIVNINNASVAELMTLPGIGEVYANRIIMFRNENGAFRRPEDIMKVSGISRVTFESIKDYIRL